MFLTQENYGKNQDLKNSDREICQKCIQKLRLHTLYTGKYILKSSYSFFSIQVGKFNGKVDKIVKNISKSLKLDRKRAELGDIWYVLLPIGQFKNNILKIHYE